MDALRTAAKTGNWKGLDMSRITTETINSYHYQHGNLLHVAARAGNLKKVPKNLLTQKGLICVDKGLNSVFHIAAEHKELHAIPKKFLTEENLEKRNEDGNTVFHYAAFMGCLKAIPDKLLTDRNLSLENSRKHGSLEYALAAWKPNKTDTQNKAVKKTIELILSKHGTERLKLYIAKYQDQINEYKELLTKVEKQAARTHVEKMVKEASQKQALIIKETISRNLPKILEKEAMEI